MYLTAFGYVITMVTVDEAIIAKMDRNGRHFEILVDPDIAYSLREGRSVSLQKMLAVNMIFTDAKKGTKASPSDIASAFGNPDVEVIAKDIVLNGDLQLTTEFRKEKTEERKRQIATAISRNAFDPKTRLPHPPGRIINAMEQAKVSVNPFRPAEQQVEAIVKKLKEIIPISMENIEIDVEVDAAHSGRVYGILKESGTIRKDSWDASGGLSAVVSIPAGLKERFYSSINSATGGTARITDHK